jgi:DNA replication protein DnaC
MARPDQKDFSGPNAFRNYLEATQEWFKSDEAIAIDNAQKAEAKTRKEEARAKFLAYLPAEIDKIIHKAGVPDRARISIAVAMEDTEARRAASGAIDMLVLSGNPGCGKTVAAAEWIHAYLSDVSKWGSGVDWNSGIKFVGHMPVWVTAAKLARWERYYEDTMKTILTSPRLVIDDLGGEYLDKGGFYASLLDEIVNERQAGSRPTIMTTNLASAAFKERYGERIVDRIREGGRFFECGNSSLRRRPTT